MYKVTSKVEKEYIYNKYLSFSHNKLKNGEIHAF